MSIELIHAAPDFSDPLGLLSACHGRIEAQCATLLRLLAHLQTSGSDEQARQAAVKILKYFNTAGKYHHEDEEIDLFPVLIQIAAAENNEDPAIWISELRSEHLTMETAWQTLAIFLERIAANQPVFPDDLAVAHFVNLYRTHMHFEDKLLFPYARKRLSAAQLSVLGLNMATRRNVHSKQL